MRFLFVNQFIPPDEAPTSLLLGDLAGALEAEGHEVVWVGSQGGYRTRNVRWGGRMLREVAALSSILLAGWKAPRCGVILCLSSPPLLLVVVRLMKFRHCGAKLIHWAMDLYPEVAVALGEVREGSLLHRFTAALMGGAYRDCDLVVALDAEMAERIGRHGVGCLIHPPWPPAIPTQSANEVPRPEAFVWLYSGNLGRAHEWRTVLEAQRLLEDRRLPITLVFQGSGPERSKAEAHASELGLQSCLWRSYAPNNQLLDSLLAADALIVTQRPETQGCLWPSKLALGLLLDRPIVWVGCGSGGIAKMLEERGHVVGRPGGAEDLAKSMETLFQSGVAAGKADEVAKVQARVAEARAMAIGKLTHDLLNRFGDPGKMLL